jgi:hypothetical protein
MEITLDERLKNAEMDSFFKVKKLATDCLNNEDSKEVSDEYMKIAKRRAVEEHIESLNGKDNSLALIGFAKGGQDLREYAKPIIEKSINKENELRERLIPFVWHDSDSILYGDDVTDFEMVNFFKESRIYDLKRTFKSRLIVPKPLSDFSRKALKSKYFWGASFLGGLAAAGYNYVENGGNSEMISDFAKYALGYLSVVGGLIFGCAGNVDNLTSEREEFIRDMNNIQDSLDFCYHKCD